MSRWARTRLGSPLPRPSSPAALEVAGALRAGDQQRLGEHAGQPRAVDVVVGLRRLVDALSERPFGAGSKRQHPERGEPGETVEQRGAIGCQLPVELELERARLLGDVLGELGQRHLRPQRPPLEHRAGQADHQAAAGVEHAALVDGPARLRLVAGRDGQRPRLRAQQRLVQPGGVGRDLEGVAETIAEVGGELLPMSAGEPEQRVAGEQHTAVKQRSRCPLALLHRCVAQRAAHPSTSIR